METRFSSVLSLLLSAGSKSIVLISSVAFVILFYPF